MLPAIVVHVLHFEEILRESEYLGVAVVSLFLETVTTLILVLLYLLHSNTLPQILLADNTA